MNITNIKKIALSLLAASLLISAGCSTDSGAENKETPKPPLDDSKKPFVYQGKSAISADITVFKREVWDKLVDNSHGCRGCHTQDGNNTPFVRTDDINLAYNEMLKLIDRDDPAKSTIVQRVRDGHQCWRNSTQVCGDNMQSYIENWVSDSVSSGGSVVLSPPTARAPGANKIMPVTPDLYRETIYNKVAKKYCVDCHSSSAENAQSPYFADANINTAYDAAKSKINIVSTASSQFVTKLGGEQHNCWEDCQSAAKTMLDAVNEFVNGIEVSGIDSSLTINSTATDLTEGIVASSSGGRHDDHVIAMYEFKRGEGSTAFDTSGVTPALDLGLSGDFKWVAGWGIRFGSNGSWGKAQGSSSNTKLFDKITTANEYSIEAWVAPANVTQGDAEEETARIVSYSASNEARNFTLGQHLYNYDFLNRNTSPETNNNGTPALSTADADERLQATLQHVVVTYNETQGRKIYVNGEFTGDSDPAETGSMSNWSDNYALVLGAETSRAYPWAGVIKMVAIHNRALSEDKIKQNFDSGVGEKFYLMFNIAEFTKVPDSYIVFEVSEFDDYSYLFNAPFFHSVNGSVTNFDNIRIKNMRIGLNGKAASVGQAYSNLDYTITAENYLAAENRHLAISRLGTVIQRDKLKNQGTDEFFLSFEVLGDATNIIAVPNPEAPAPVYDNDVEQPAIGLKTFEEINASMASLTGISMFDPAHDDIKTVFETVKQQLPSKENIEGFLSSQQMGITQLAIKYCSALVEDTQKRDIFFPNIDFTQNPDNAFSDTSVLSTSLANKLLGQNIGASQPEQGDIKNHIETLVNKLNTCPNRCNSERTQSIVKASCAAVLGSATTLIQ